MRVSERGQITIPKPEAEHPVDRISGMLDGAFDIDEYIEEIRGR